MPAAAVLEGGVSENNIGLFNFWHCLFQRVAMPYAAMEHMDMVPIREDWARRSVAAMGSGPYSAESLGRMEYENLDMFISFINYYLTGS
jgi:hypothetical protein